MNEAQKEDDLDAVQKEILEACRKNAPARPVFLMPGRMPLNYSLDWLGTDILSFLKCAEAVDAKLLYLGFDFADPEEDVPEQHEGEISEWQLAFLHGGFFHVYRVHEPWYREFLERQEAEVEEEEAEETGEELVAMDEGSREALIGDFLDLLENGGEVDLSLYDLKRRLGEHLVESHGLPRDTMTAYELRRREEIDDELLESLDRLDKLLTDLSGRREEDKASELAPKAVAWARENNLKTVNKGDIEEFLQQQGLKVSSKTESRLWNKTRFLMKAKPK